jgi:hypothetical protein
LVRASVSRAIGELVLQTASESVGEEVLQELESSQTSSWPTSSLGPLFGPHPKGGANSHNLEPHPPVLGPHPPKGIADFQTLGPHPKGTSAAGTGFGNDEVELLQNPRPPAPAPPAPSPAPPPAQEPVNPRPPGITMSGADSGVSVTHNPPLVADNYVLVEEFLAPDELKELSEFVLARESEFVLSEVVSPGVPGEGQVAHQYRRSRVLTELGAHEQKILDRLQAVVPRVMDRLAMQRFTPSRSEIQITASNHGDFFREHSDTGQAEIATRALTFVYFFHAEPRPFRGGALRLFDSRPVHNGWRREGGAQTIVPQQNQIIFFPSELVHEITPIVCESHAFADSRFTVNGWLHR